LTSEKEREREEKGRKKREILLWVGFGRGRCFDEIGSARFLERRKESSAQHDRRPSKKKRKREKENIFFFFKVRSKKKKANEHIRLRCLQKGKGRRRPLLLTQLEGKKEKGKRD